MIIVYAVVFISGVLFCRWYDEAKRAGYIQRRK